MRVIDTSIAAVKLLEPTVHGDDRGFFLESWNRRTFAEIGAGVDFVQDNHSRSRQGVLRGLHYQIDQPQGKLVRVVAGAVFDVAVDMRASSLTLGQWVGYELSAANRRMLWIPEGFAHGFLTLQDNTDFLYKCTRAYDPSLERCVTWDDPTLEVNWPLSELTPIVSSKDSVGASFELAEKYP